MVQLDALMPTMCFKFVEHLVLDAIKDLRQQIQSHQSKATHQQCTRVMDLIY